MAHVDKIECDGCCTSVNERRNTAIAITFNLTGHVKEFDLCEACNMKLMAFLKKIGVQMENC